MQLPADPTFAEFWPWYLGEHRRHATRAIHTLGTVAYLSWLGAALVARKPELALACPVIAYGAAWLSHLFVEKNRPATFRHPLLSLWADHVMAWYVLTGRIDAELKRLGIKSLPEAR
ncbi:Mpo1-like protein [Vulgatibacter sp.]|uniref:Mpo1-like protein n=1 Tax=Vulgatibacter sp. TaxID=1971226 RepID=UPI00356AACB7